MKNFTKIANGHFVKSCLLREILGKFYTLSIVTVENVVTEPYHYADWELANEFHRESGAATTFTARINGVVKRFAYRDISRQITIYEEGPLKIDEEEEVFLVDGRQVFGPGLVEFIRTVVRRTKHRGSGFKAGFFEPIALS